MFRLSTTIRRSAYILAAIISIAASSARADIIFAYRAAFQEIITFDSISPGIVLQRGFVTSGLQPGEALWGMDFRPATGELLAVGTSHRLYRLNLDNLANHIITAEQIGRDFEALNVTGSYFGMDVDPVNDIVRFVSNDGLNWTIDPKLQSQVTFHVPYNGFYFITSIAYNNNHLNSGASTLFGLSAEINSLVRIGGVDGNPSPNFGGVTELNNLHEEMDGWAGLDYGGFGLYASVHIGGHTLLYLLSETGTVLNNLGVIADDTLISTIAVAPETLTVSKVAVKLNFATQGKDSIKVSGLMPVPDGFVVANNFLLLDVGGVNRSFILDEKGKSIVGPDSFKLKVVSDNGVVSAQMAKFQATFKLDTFADNLLDEGLTNETLSAVPRRIPVTILIDNRTIQTQKNVLYTAKQGKTGKAK